MWLKTRTFESWINRNSSNCFPQKEVDKFLFIGLFGSLV